MNNRAAPVKLVRRIGMALASVNPRCNGYGCNPVPSHREKPMSQSLVHAAAFAEDAVHIGSDS